MRKCFAMMAVVLLAGGATDSLARDTEMFLPNTSAPRPGDLLGDLPAGAVSQSYTREEGDTLCFGYVDGGGFAVVNETWTFDHGAGTLEGWYGVDVTEQGGAYFRQITTSIWDADAENNVAAPVFGTQGAAWVGVFGTQALELCWSGGLGYGNDWCQRLLSPTQSYGGSGTVQMSWNHFNDTEPDFDYTNVILQLLPNQEEAQLRHYTGALGLAGDHPVSPPDGVADSEILTSSDFGGAATQYRIVLELTSDGSWSDEDALQPTEYGPAGFDDFVIAATTYNFESTLQGWTAEGCPGFGTFLGIAPLSDYVIEDPCQCELAGNVLEFHRGPGGTGDHPTGQHVYGVSPPVDVLNDVTPASLPGTGQLAIFAEWDQYSLLPQANGVLYRPGAYYFPFLCEVNPGGDPGWSDRIGQNSFFYVGEDPNCAFNRNVLTAVDGQQLPTDCEQVRFIFEVYASCDAFGIPEEVCTEVTNFTPIIDNIQMCFSRVAQAPNIAFELGLRFQDGFAQGPPGARPLINDPNKHGRSDVTRNIVGFGNTNPFVLGDSIQVAGPVVSSPAARWESHFWFRVSRKGPGSDGAYTTWKNQVQSATGINIESGSFASASMDSAQVGSQVAKNKFTTYLKEADWSAWGRPGAGPELSDATEIIPDNVLFPGTQVEYFLTANFVSTPSEKFFLPDTSGGFFLEYEILPSWRDIGGGTLRYPCLLYIDAFNVGAQVFIEAAIEGLGFDVDRYDYLDATSNWKAPMARGGTVDANNGCTLPQLLGYRGILVNTGTSNVTQLMWPEDYSMFSDWLTAIVCGSDATRQGLIMNGDGVSLAMGVNSPTLLARMGATHVDDWYADYSGNQATCVALTVPLDLGQLYGTTNSAAPNYLYDAYGNWCPQQFNFDVIDAVGLGVGNRVYLDDSVNETSFAQVASENIVGEGEENYRTVIDGVSWHHMVSPENGGADRCVASAENIESAAFNEMAAAIEWIYEVDYDQYSSFCEDPCADPGELIDVTPSVGRGVTKLFQNSPNPFNPRTAIRFALATTGPAEVSVFDVTGRKVRTLVKGELEAGSHEVVWDGSDDAGRPLTSGVYWTQLTAGGHTFNKKATVLR